MGFAKTLENNMGVVKCCIKVNGNSNETNQRAQSERRTPDTAAIIIETRPLVIRNALEYMQDISAIYIYTQAIDIWAAHSRHLYLMADA